MTYDEFQLCILGRKHLFSGMVDFKIQKTVSYLLLATFIAILTPTKTEKVQCPNKCHCSTDFTTVKCRGFDKFPVLDFAAGVRTLDLSRGQISDIEKKDLEAYKNLHFLDIRHNQIKSVSPGLFSDMTTLRELYVSYNPWSCDTTTLHVLQMELIALADKNSHLNNFDGGKMECFDPPNMKGKKPLHSAHSTVKVLHVHKLMKGRMADQHQIPAGVIALSVFLVMLLFTAVGGAVWVFRENLQDLFMNVWRLKPQSDPANKMEAGEMYKDLLTSKTSSNKGVVDAGKETKPNGQLDNKSILIDKRKKRSHKSQGLPASRNSALCSDNKAAGIPAKNKKTPDELNKRRILYENMKKRRRMSQGLPASQSNSASSSDDEATVKPANNKKTPDELSKKSIFKENMKKRRRMSQGLPASQSNTASNSDDEARVKPANKKTPNELSKKSILMKNMKKWHRMSHGLQASQSQSAPSSDGEATVTPANNKKTPDKLDSDTVLIDSMKKRRRMSQGLPTTDVKGESNSENEAEVNSTCNLEERMSRQRRQSCGFAEGENSSFSEEDSGFTPQ